MPVATLRIAPLTLLLAALAVPASAQQPLSHTSVEALVQALKGSGSGPTARAFTRTRLPEAGTSLCEGAGAAPAAAPAAPALPASGSFDVATIAGKAPAAPAAGARARNLEVVPYAGDTTPGVNLDVRFATASDKLTKTDQQLLDTLAQALKSKDLAKDRFAVAGHTDATGDDRINQELSCARALAVKRYLSGKGVAVARLSAYGFGSGRPLEAGQADSPNNRRVEIRKAPE